MFLSSPIANKSARKKILPLLISVSVVMLLACSKPKDADEDIDSPHTSASIDSGLYRAQTVKLTCDDGNGSGCLSTYYTIDGTTPNRASTPYSGPIAIRSGTTLKYFSIDIVGNVENVVTKEYYIGTIVLKNTSSFSAGWNHSVAIKDDGTLWAWGGNAFGQLGNGIGTGRTTPSPIRPDEKWVKAKAGKSYTLAIKEDGTLWAWGKNDKGQLGNNSTSDSAIPIQIGTDNNWSKISPGMSHSLAIRNDGTLWVWGANQKGQLGNDTSIDSLVPIKVGIGTSWKDVAAGDDFSVALRNDGTVWTWGANTYGQLGIGTNTDSKLPTMVIETGWTAISAGSNHVIAIKDDGTLWSWGQNWYGQLGHGTTITKAWAGNGFRPITGFITFDKRYPFQIGTYTDWKAISTGHGHTLGIRNDGRLWAWGLNVNGQLGDGTIMDNLLPLPVGTETGLPNILPKHPWIKISAGSHHSVALRNDGTLWSWGWNGSGQLGDGSLESTSGGSDPITPTWRIPKYAYVVSDRVYSYTVNYTTGLLTPNGSPIGAGKNPKVAAIHRTNKLLYVVDSSIDRISPSYITTFLINKETGKLTKVGKSVETLIGARSIYIDPLGRFLYVVGRHMRKWNFEHTAVYTIDPVTGELTCVGTSVNGIRKMTFDPLGKFAFVIKADYYGKRNSLLTYKIDQTTGILPDVGDNDLDYNDLGVPTTAINLAVDRSGQFLYLTSQNEISVYSINQTDGAFLDTGFKQAEPGFSDYIFSESNLYIYMLFSANLNVFVVNQITGQVTDAGLEPAKNAIGAVTDPTGKFVYIFTPNFVNGYAIDPHHGSTMVIGPADDPTKMSTDAAVNGVSIKALLLASF